MQNVHFVRLIVVDNFESYVKYIIGTEQIELFYRETYRLRLQGSGDI